MRPGALGPWKRAALIAAGILLLLWFAAVARAAFQAGDDLSRGRDQIKNAQDSLSLEAVVDGSAAKDLRSASFHFAAADEHLDAPFLAPARLLPIVGRQLRSVSSLSDTGDELLGKAAELSEELGRIDTKTGPGRVAALEVLSTRAAEFETAIAEADLGPNDGLVGGLWSTRAELDSRLDELRQNLHQVVLASRGLSALARGPSRVLVLATTNAEMRIGQGAALQYGIVEIADGSLRTSGFQRAGALGNLPGGLADPDVAANWGWASPPNLGFVALTPRFDAVARHALAMVSQVTGQQFDAVVQLDTVAITRLVSLTGPVDTVVGGQPVRGLVDEALLQHLLYGQYFGVSAVDADRENAERRDALSGMAAEAIARTERGDVEVGETVEVLATMVRSRHLQVFSERPEVQAAFEALGAGPQLPTDVLTLALFNANANKLDPFVKIDADVELTEHPDRTSVRVTTRIRNEAPTDAPPYVTGQPPPGAPSLGYDGMLTFTVPGNARALWFGDGVPVNVLGNDGPNQVISTLVSVPRRDPATRTLSFDLPAGSTLTIVPTAREPEVYWRVNGKHYGDDELHTVAA